LPARWQKRKRLDEADMPPASQDAIDSDVAQLRAMREAYEHHEIGYSHP